MWTVAALLLLAASRAAADPIDSDLADARTGGGCYTTALQPSILDMLTLINPEWAPVVNGQVVDSDSVQISGTVRAMHGETGGDFPSTHLLSDVVMDVVPDAADADRVATGNDHPGELLFEWEVGPFPDWAWPGFGDRIVGRGRHIFDCGHPAPIPGRCSTQTARECVLDTDCRPPVCSTCGELETCDGEHFRYSSELHPPHATAVIRRGRGGIVSKRPAARPVPATLVDVWVSPDGGGAGDRCVIEHRALPADQLAIECFPLSQPVAPINAQDFTFEVPLPPRPPGAGKPRWRFTPAEAFGDVPARLRVRRRLGGDAPHLEVRVRMTKKVKGRLPTGFAGRLVAGWKTRTASLTGVRVTVSALLIANDLQRAQPIAPRECSTSLAPCGTDADCPAGEACWGAGPVKGWRGQLAVNGEWRQLVGSALDEVTDGAIVPQSIVVEQYLPSDGSLRIQADAFARECIHTIYGQSLAEGLRRFGFNKGVACLGGDDAHTGGRIDVTYPGPDFGSGGGSQTYETESVGGEGGTCSLTSGLLCLVDADCPAGETCLTTGGAFRLRYTIERLA